MLARSGTYNVQSRVVDDDKTVWLDFEWCEFTCLYTDTSVSVSSRLLDRRLLVLTRGLDNARASGWEGRPPVICGGGGQCIKVRKSLCYSVQARQRVVKRHYRRVDTHMSTCDSPGKWLLWLASIIL
jgi:hypothetical protein